MSPVTIVLLVILAVLIAATIALYFLGKKAQKRKDEQDAQLAATAQTVTMLIIDKKRMRLNQSGLPQAVIDQTPKLMRRSKLPIVKAKVGPKVMTLIADDACFDMIPVKKEVKATVSGIYITKVTGVRGPLEKPEGKVSWRTKLKRKAESANKELQKEKKSMNEEKAAKKSKTNYEWKDKIKEGNTQDLLEVLHGIEKEVRELVEGSLEMMIDEQKESNQVAGRVLGKVNLVNDWAKRLRNELERKPTIQEVADKMGISPEQVTEAIRLSAEAIEDIDYVKTMPQADTKADVPNKPVGKISFQ